jgi:hypothetical protein
MDKIFIDDCDGILIINDFEYTSEISTASKKLIILSDMMTKMVSILVFRRHDL